MHCPSESHQTNPMDRKQQAYLGAYLTNASTIYVDGSSCEFGIKAEIMLVSHEVEESNHALFFEQKRR